MNSFTYQYPVKNYFGEGALHTALAAELPAMGEKVMLAYGGGSIKRTGLYDEIVAALQDAGKTVVEFPGIMPNPTYEKVQEGARIAREEGSTSSSPWAAARCSIAARSSPLRRCSTRTSTISSTCRTRRRPPSSRWGAWSRSPAPAPSRTTAASSLTKPPR